MGDVCCADYVVRVLVLVLVLRMQFCCGGSMDACRASPFPFAVYKRTQVFTVMMSTFSHTEYIRAHKTQLHVSTT